MLIICPYCENSIEAAGEGAAVLCPSCGNSFRLDEERTCTYSVEHRRLGKFELLERVGSGTFGAVWRARDTELGRLVAVKIPHAEQLATEQDSQRFLREARSAAQLRHPGIVTVHEVGHQENLPYLVADFIEGVTLSDLLTSRRLGFRESAELVAEVAEALEYAHAMGVVHRDVKPSNIMLERSTCASNSISLSPGRPLLMDFGLARHAEAEATMTFEGQVLGTPAYMSPEQAAGHSHKVDARSDVYSVGVVLYLLLTGELPFRGNTRMLLEQVLREEPKPPRRLNDQVPRDLETICLKAMAKEPSGRYASARELADDLRRHLAGEPIRARPMATWERAWRWVKRRPAAVALLAVSGVATLALVGVAVALTYNVRLQAARRAEIRYAYFNHVLLAQRELEANNVARALEHLEQCPAQYRGWEWHYLTRQCHPERLTFRAHQAILYRLAYSPDGTRLATTSEDGTVRVWDAETGRQHLEIRGPVPHMFCAVYSPDGRHLAALGNHADRVAVYAAETGREEQSFSLETGNYGDLAFSPDGRYLAVAGGEGVESSLVTVLDLNTGKRRFTATCPGEGIVGVAFAPDGQRIAVAVGSLDFFTIAKRPGQVRILDAATGTPVATLTGHTGPLTSVAYSADGTRLATGSMDHTARVYDVASGRELHTLRGHTQMINEVAFHPKDNRLATASDDNSIRVWDVKSGQELFTLRGHTNQAVSLAFHPDGSCLASASIDGTIKVWDVTAKEALSISSFPDGATGVTFLPDGRRLAAASLGGIARVCDVSDGRTVETIAWPNRPIWDVSCHPNGRLLAAATGDWLKADQRGEVRLCDLVTGQVLHTLRGHIGLAWKVAFSPDGARLASVGGRLDRPGEVKVWDVATGTERLNLRLDRGMMAVAFSPDGSRIASAGGPNHRANLLDIWDAATGRLMHTLEGHKERIHAISFSPDGARLASASYDGTVRVWDAATGRPTFPPLGHKSSVLCVAFSPDGRRIVSGGEDLTIKLWDATTGQEALSLRGHTDTIWGVAFSPDRHRLASSSRDGTVRIWDATPLSPTAQSPVE